MLLRQPELSRPSELLRPPESEMLRWCLFCEAQSGIMRKAFDAHNGGRVGPWLFTDESRVIFSRLCELTRLGFYTLSSQPSGYQTPFTTQLHQRAYVVGYLPRSVRHGLVQLLETCTSGNIVVGNFPGEIQTSHTGRSDNKYKWQYNWGGDMPPELLCYHGLGQFPALDLCPLELIDVDWRRPDCYLFDTLIDILRDPCGFYEEFRRKQELQHQQKVKGKYVIHPIVQFSK